MLGGAPSGIMWGTLERRESGGKIYAVFGTRTTVQKEWLLTESTMFEDGDPNYDSDRLHDGVVAMHYPSVAPPFVAEVAWWSLSTGRVSRYLVRTPAQLRITSTGGGLLFQSDRVNRATSVIEGRSIQFGHPGGRVDVLAIPGNEELDSALRLRKRWIVTRHALDDAELLWSDDGLRGWKTKSWPLEPPRPTNDVFVIDRALTLIGGSSVMVYQIDNQVLLYDVSRATLEAPPQPKVLDTMSDVPCDEHAGGHRMVVSLPDGTPRLRVQIAGNADDFEEATRIVHITSASTTCASAYVLEPHGTQGSKAFLFPDGPRWTGWWFAPTGKTFIAQPLACQPDAR